MAGFCQTIKERDVVQGAPVIPSSSATLLQTGAVDMSKGNRVVFWGGVGTLGINAVVAAYLQQTNSSDGGNGTNLAGSAITNISTANRFFSMEVQAEQLTARYVVGVVDPSQGAANASIVFLLPLLTELRYAPGNSLAYNTSRVQNIVSNQGQT